MRNVIAIAATLGMVTVTAHAASISTSTTAPTVDGEDISNLTVADTRLKWFHDVEHDAGQTFTPGADAVLNAWTIRLSHPNEIDAGTESVLIRLGTITRPGDVFTFTDIYSELAETTGPDWNADDYLTFTLNTPQGLTAGVEYGIINDAQSMGDWHHGIPYIHRSSGSSYADGVGINRGGEGNFDLAFHADLGSGAAPGTMILVR